MQYNSSLQKKARLNFSDSTMFRNQLVGMECLATGTSCRTDSRKSQVCHSLYHQRHLAAHLPSGSP